MRLKSANGISAGRSAGFTMLELLVAMAILLILIKVSLPSLQTMSANQHLVGAAEQVYGHLQQARAEAISRNKTVYLNFSASGTTTWSYGMTTYTSNCDLTKTTATATGACVMVINDGDSTVDDGSGTIDSGDLVLYRFPSSDFTDVSMDISGFSAGGTQLTFSPLRGTSTSGTIQLTSLKGAKLYVQLSLLGHPRLCTPDNSVRGYPKC